MLIDSGNLCQPQAFSFIRGKILWLPKRFDPQGSRNEDVRELSTAGPDKRVLQWSARLWCSTTNVLTATTIIYAVGAGITAAAGTRLALQWFLNTWFGTISFQLGSPKDSPLIGTVTTSRDADWVICAPAAFLGCSSRVSCSFSGIELWFPVTRNPLGSPRHYRQRDRAVTWMKRRRREDVRSEW